MASSNPEPLIRIICGRIFHVLNAQNVPVSLDEPVTNDDDVQPKNFSAPAIN